MSYEHSASIRCRPQDIRDFFYIKIERLRDEIRILEMSGNTNSIATITEKRAQLDRLVDAMVTIYKDAE